MSVPPWPLQITSLLLVVLREQAIRGHVVSGHRDARVGGVDGPAHRVAVVSAPGPYVVDDRIRRIVQRLTVAETGVVSAPPMRKKTSWTRSGLLASLGPGSRPRAGPRLGRAGVDHEAGQLHPVVPDHDHGRVAALRNKGGHAQAQHHGVGVRDHDGLVQVVDARVRMRFWPHLYIRVCTRAAPLRSESQQQVAGLH